MINSKDKDSQLLTAEFIKNVCQSENLLTPIHICFSIINSTLKYNTSFNVLNTVVVTVTDSWPGK